MAIEDWFTDPSKGLVRSVRPAQVTMAKAVDDVIQNGGIAFIEAGTGTGKSFAYSVPAMLSDKRVVISTAKKALQQQLIGADLPHVANGVNSRPYSILKGKGNHACRLRWADFSGTSAFHEVNPEEAKIFQAWLDQSEDADMAGLPDYKWLHHARVSECVRKACPYAEGCGYVKSRNKGATAQVLVVNHALLAQDLAIGGGKILGAYDVLIIDEAHQAPKFFRDAYALRLTPRQPEHLARLLKDTQYDPGTRLFALYDAIFAEIPKRNQHLGMSGPLVSHLTQLRDIAAKALTGMLKAEMLEDDDGYNVGDETAARIKAQLRSASQMLVQMRTLAEVALGEYQHPLGDRVEWVKYIEKGARDEWNIVTSPVEIGPLVAPALLGIGRVVVTSATLSVFDRMDYMAREYGLATSQIKHSVILPSPFDYKNKSALYVAADAPDPAERGGDYYRKMATCIHELLEASSGGAFVLCSSTDDMRELFEAIRKMYFPLPYVLTHQRPGVSFEDTVNWFKSGKNHVLMGLKTFWEGVDIPGDTLRLVVIPRLPFPNRADILLGARKEVYINAQVRNGVAQKTAEIRSWEAFDLQEAVMDLKQGGGRLIRTENDRGVVALLDLRAHAKTKAYASRVRGSLPHPHLADKAMVLNILRALGAQATA